MSDLAACIGLNEPSGGRADGAAHVGNEEATLGLSTNLVRDGTEKSAVAVCELGRIGVGNIPVEGRILSLQKRQETSSHQSLAINRGAKMMGRVATGWDIADVDDLAEGVLCIALSVTPL